MFAFIPLATPVCSAGTAATTSADIAENASPKPTPMMAVDTYRDRRGQQHQPRTAGSSTGAATGAV